MAWHLFSQVFLIAGATIVLILKLRKDGEGRLDRPALLTGLASIGVIAILLPLIGLTKESLGTIGGLILYLVIPSAVYLAYYYKPEVFRVRQKVVTWILLGLLLVMATVAISSLSLSSNKSAQEIERIRDLPNLEESKRHGVNPNGGRY